MIKFIRKIRYDLLDKNKTGKYLKYAIGEIVLVVIGILIALSINNWNEERKESSLENIYLIGVKKDLESTKMSIENFLERYPNDLQYIESAINYIGKEANELTESMKDTITSTGFGRIEVIDGTINALLNSGKLELISNDSLKIRITEYPTFVNSLNVRQRELGDVVLNQQRPILERHFSLTDHLTDTIKFPNLKNRALPSDFKSLLKDREYQNVLVNLRYHLYISQNRADKLLSKTIGILKIVEVELKKK